MSNIGISNIIANIAKVLVVIGLIFIFWKMIKKISKKKNYQEIDDKKKMIWYNIHKSTLIISTILGFVHFIILGKEADSEYLLSGWILGVSMIILSIQGIYLGFKSDWQPFTGEEDQQYKTMRILKWILTPVMFLALVWHFFPTVIF